MSASTKKEYEGDMTPPIGIEIVDSCVSDCDVIYKYLMERPEWNDSTIDLGDVDPQIRKSKTISFPMLSWQNPSIIHHMNREVWTAMDQYASKFDFSFSSIENVSIQQYGPDDFYKPHVDAGGFAPRVVSAVLYLNDVAEGGETRFTLFDYSVSPVAGRLAIFPSDYIYKHEALAPKQGIKVAAAYWARY